MARELPVSTRGVWISVLTLALGLGGCFTPTDPGPDTTGWGSGYGGQGGTGGWGCEKDSQCGSEVCARDGECLPASAVRTVHVTWTLQGQPASDATCAHSPDLEITFTSNTGDRFGFLPVPCAEGRFTVDKIPTAYEQTSLAAVVGNSASEQHPAAFDAAGNATIDLPY